MPEVHCDWELCGNNIDGICESKETVYITVAHPDDDEELLGCQNFEYKNKNTGELKEEVMVDENKTA